MNLLLCAEIDAYPQRVQTRLWWEETLSGDVIVGLPAITLFGFIRIATSRRVFEDPLQLSDALARADLFDRPDVDRLLRLLWHRAALSPLRPQPGLRFSHTGEHAHRPRGRAHPYYGGYDAALNA